MRAGGGLSYFTFGGESIITIFLSKHKFNNERSSVRLHELHEAHETSSRITTLSAPMLTGRAYHAWDIVTAIGSLVGGLPCSVAASYNIRFTSNIPMASPVELVQIDLTPRRPQAKPAWLRARAPLCDNYHNLKKLARTLDLHTVCESAQCPNIGECWNHKTATFMLLGNLCTRRCGFCAVPKGRPEPLDWDEPRRVAEAVATLGLKHAVVTSVNRDDDSMGGARIFAETIREIRQRTPDCRLEVLIPDFQGMDEALKVVLDAHPDVLNHNTESVPRLYRVVRSGARYERTLTLLQNVKKFSPGMVTKSGVMVGLGETSEELVEVFRDLGERGVDILTVGQYLRPSKEHLPIARFYTPTEFTCLRDEAMPFAFRHVESGPLVRSSYHAHEQAAATSKPRVVS